MKLIDKDSLIEHMRKAYKGNTKAGFKWDLLSAVAVIGAEEEITPDAEPVVRCKDCKFNYANQIPSDDECQLCVELPISKDFFCAYGEKMDEV